MVKEARKYGLGLILSSQETRDFHPSIFANTGTLISLALEDADASVMASHLGLTEKAEQRIAKQIILDQASGQSLIRSTHYQQIMIQSFEDRRRPRQSESASEPPARTPPRAVPEGLVPNITRPSTLRRGLLSGSY